MCCLLWKNKNLQAPCTADILTCRSAKGNVWPITLMMAFFYQVSQSVSEHSQDHCPGTSSHKWNAAINNVKNSTCASPALTSQKGSNSLMPTHCTVLLSAWLVLSTSGLYMAVTNSFHFMRVGQISTGGGWKGANASICQKYKYNLYFSLCNYISKWSVEVATMSL